MREAVSKTNNFRCFCINTEEILFESEDVLQKRHSTFFTGRLFGFVWSLRA